MTFTEIIAAVCEEALYQTTPAPAVTTRLKRFVNEGLRAIVSEPGLSRLVDSDQPYTFPSVANQARYVVPESVDRILAVSERTNDYALSVMPLSTYRMLQPDTASMTGTPTHLVPIGRTAVAVQPSDASEIFIKSTAAETPTAYLEGITTGGYMRSTSAAMTGVTAKSLDTAITTFTEITDWYLSANAVGAITLLEDSGLGTELARITIGQKRPRYYGFYLWPTPAAVVTYYVDYRRAVTDLVQDTDEPPFGQDWHSLLVDYAVQREFEQKDDPQRVLIAKQRYDKKLSRLKYATQSLSGEIPVQGRGTPIGHSRLGANYPADWWGV